MARHLPPGSIGDWASVLGLTVSLGALVASITFVVRAVAPTVMCTERFSRYSWSVADAPIASIVNEMMAATPPALPL